MAKNYEEIMITINSRDVSLWGLTELGTGRVPGILESWQDVTYVAIAQCLLYTNVVKLHKIILCAFLLWY